MFLIFVFIVIMPDAAHAHAYPDHADPKVGSTVSASPSMVRIWFDSALEPAFCSIMVHIADGAMVDKRDGHVDPADPTLLEISVPPLPPGAYRVILERRGQGRPSHLGGLYVHHQMKP